MFGMPHEVQVLLFFKSLGPGLITGAVFLLFHSLRLLFRHHPLAVFFEDLLFFCCSALLLYYFLFTFHAGIPRFYLLAGDAVGVLLCMRCFLPLTDRFLARCHRNRPARKNGLPKQKKRNRPRTKSASSKQKEKNKKKKQNKKLSLRKKKSQIRNAVFYL